MRRRGIRATVVALLGATALPALGTAPHAGAADGNLSWTCAGANDDTGAMVSSAIGEISSRSALMYASVTIQPSTVEYSITDLPPMVEVGSAPLAIDAQVTLPSGSNAQLADGLATFFGLTNVQ
jgi:hypothetical protein